MAGEVSMVKNKADGWKNSVSLVDLGVSGLVRMLTTFSELPIAFTQEAFYNESHHFTQGMVP